jgi:lysophospholipase L1-like esterase
MSSARRRLAGFVVCCVLSLAFTATALADNYAALGDSYSSGNGTNSYTLSSSCSRGVYAYPYLAFQQRPNTVLTFVACGGATTSDVINTQVNSLSASTNQVSITIGGNDIGFASLITNCTLANCLTALQTANTNIQNTLPAKLEPVGPCVRLPAVAAPGDRLIQALPGRPRPR